jgi:hypothetical protein
MLTIDTPAPHVRVLTLDRGKAQAEAVGAFLEKRSAEFAD